jgi:phospholipid/cholesterol/gamma-HCH transport system permease protein
MENKKSVDFVTSLGAKALDLLATVSDMFYLLMQTLHWLFIGPFKGKAAKRDSIFDQMVFVGVRSIIIVFFIAIFTGIVLAMQSAYQLQQLGAVIYVTGLVAVSQTRELGPVLTALVVAGRVGAAITAQLGSMKVTEQIESLETMAMNPVRFLVVPRFLALLVMLPALTAIADLSGILGGFLIGVTNLNINGHLYIEMTKEFLALKDIMTGLLKSAVFGVIICLVACYKGLNTEGGAEGVGKATTESVVTSFVLIILADAILTAAFYFGNM